MVKISFAKVVACCAAIALARAAEAQMTDVDLLLCNFAKTGRASSPDAWNRLHLDKAASDRAVVPGPVREQELCIQNASISGAFGVFVVLAELCNSTPQPLYDWLAKNRPLLQRSTTETGPGVIANFGTEKDGVFIFHGRASNNWKRDSTEPKLAFACVIAGSGAQ